MLSGEIALRNNNYYYLMLFVCIMLFYILIFANAFFVCALSCLLTHSLFISSIILHHAQCF